MIYLHSTLWKLVFSVNLSTEYCLVLACSHINLNQSRLDFSIKEKPSVNNTRAIGALNTLSPAAAAPLRFGRCVDIIVTCLQYPHANAGI